MKRPSLPAAVAQVFRFEYVYSTLPGMTITFFLCAESPSEFFALPVIEGLLIIALVMFGGLGINAIIDREIDSKYENELKRRIPLALDVLGVRATWAVIVLMTLLALALGAHLSFHFQSWLPFLLVLADVFLGYGYSVPPLHFKVRGVFAHGTSLVLASGFIPFVLSAYTYLGSVSPSLLLFIAGFALVHYGFEFSNQALDYLEDRKEGIQTPAVRLGVLSSLKASLAVPLVGMLIAFVGLYCLLLERFQAAGTRPFASSMPLMWGLAIVPMLIGYALPLRKVWEMYLLCRREPPESSVPKLPALCSYARWQASAVAGVAAATAVFFFATHPLH
jgi:4-hydroxybenzoate polyprenyltransferase